MIESVLFDIDDTLIEFTTASRRGFCDYLAELSPELAGPAQDTAVLSWTEIGSRCFDRYLRGELTFAAQRRMRAAEFCRTFGLPLGVGRREQDTWIASYLRYCEIHMRLYPEVGAALDALAAAGVRMGAVSNSDHQDQDRKLRRLGIRERFDALVCCDDVAGCSKPDPRMFLAGCAALRTEPVRTVYVGDRLESDARAASRAGLRGVWLNRCGHETDRDTSTVFDLAELADTVAATCCPDSTAHREASR